MRIVYFADIRFPLERANGIQTMETCYALAERGHKVRLVVRPDTQSPPRDPFAYYGLTPTGGLAIEQAPVRGPGPARRLGYLSFALGRGMGRARADLLFTRDLGLASLLLALPGSMRAPLVYESHGYSPEVAAALPELVATASRPSQRKLRRLTAREERVWEEADGYVTITVGLARELTERFGKRRHLAAIPDGCRVAPAPEASAPEVNGAPPAVAYAGHLYPWKGVDILLRALALVPGARGVIVGGHEGEPDLARVKQLAGELGIAGRVTFTGLVEPAAVPGLLRRATILALPNPASAISTTFTSPLKLFEYMAAGGAIVASDLPAVREVLHDGVDALLVPPGDPGAMASAIQRLIDDPALRSALARAALAAAPQYGWDRRAERLEALFTQVTSRRR